MKKTLKGIQNKLLDSSLFKDSFWAVFGNGLGHLLLLLAGIIIARFLGKDVYGEYGVVKTTMFYIASFSTLGLGFTATRFVAKYKETDDALLKGSIYSSIGITVISSVTLCCLLFVFSTPLALYLDEPHLSTSFRFLGIIIVVKALCTTTGAILGGTKNFKAVGINNIISGISMFLMAVVLTYIWGLNGSLMALFLSHLILCIINFIAIYNNTLKKVKHIKKVNNYNTILRFTFPVALQELSFTVSQWGVILLLTKFCSLGEVGLYSAAAQWNAIILFIPSLLSNVVLSYLSGSGTQEKQKRILYIMLLVNFIATLLPFIIVYCLSDLITSFYGDTFTGMKNVMNILVFSTIFECMSKVFQSNMISEGKNWKLFIIRTVRDTILLVLTFCVLYFNTTENGAFRFSLVCLSVCIIYFMLMLTEYICTHRNS